MKQTMPQITPNTSTCCPAPHGRWHKSSPFRCVFVLAILIALAPAANAVETLTYKGSLNDGGKAANGTYDIQVQLFTKEYGGEPVTFPITLFGVEVNDGTFQVPVDLPRKLPTNVSVWLQAEIKPMGSSDFYPLSGRQEIDSALGGACWETTGNTGLSSDIVGINDNSRQLLRLKNNASYLYIRGTGGIEQNGSIAAGVDSVALNGNSKAAAPNSIATGKGATGASHAYSVVFADGQGDPLSFASTAPNQFLVRAQNGVGINTNAPLGTLSVRRGGASGASSAYASVFTGESDTDTYITLLTPDNKERGVLFGDPVNNSSGGIIYNPVANPNGLTFRTGGNVDRLRLTSNGSLLLNAPDESPGPSNYDVVLQSRTGGPFRLNMQQTGQGGGFSFTASSNLLKIAPTYTGSVEFESGVGILREVTSNALEVDGNASKATAGAWLANSDRRIKTDIAPITNALALINGVEPVTFRYNSAYLGQHDKIADLRYYNVIAQDFAKVFPDAVKGSGEYLSGMTKSAENEILQVDTYPVTITAIAAIQELDAKASLQNDRVERLEAENAELHGRLAALEKALLGRSVSEQR